MRIFYVTLNNADEARQISRALLERQLAVCTNWFPITCAYRWEERLVEEAETVLLVKTQTGYRGSVEEVICQHLSYTNFIGEIAPESVNEGFLKWLNTEVPLSPGGDRSEKKN
jgi:periplasmic divalent cation tolerance protein